MNSVIVQSKISTLEIEAKRLLINGKSIPFRLIDLLIITQDCKIQAKDILSLNAENIAILFISKDNRKFSLALPTLAKNSELKMAQYRTATHNSLEIAKWILKHKFISHKESLEKFGIFFEINDALQNLQNTQNIDSALGIEGSVARRYFSHYFSLFERKLTKGYRSKNPPLDPINALLSFVYTIFYNQLTAMVFMGGFEPSISYLHAPFRSHYALSSDLLEFFRADINEFVANLFLDGNFDSKDFTARGGIYLTNDARGKLWHFLKPFMDETEPKMTQIISDLRTIIGII